MPRILEFVIALLGLMVLLPIITIIAVLIKLNSRGPVLFRAERAGKGGKPITIFKFRSMVKDAIKFGPPITTQEDNRITLVGKFLRKTKLDELPQLINVVKGDMCFVGPRPEDPVIVQKYTNVQRRILSYRPGITSPASIEYRAEENAIPTDQWEEIYFSDILPNKISIDLDYFQNANFWSDLMVILKTLGLTRKRCNS